jgi:hypothetical protein
MLKAEQVPDEVVLALATSMGWQSSVSDIRGVDQMKKHVAAAINAWPKTLWDYRREDGTRIILPLTESSDDK